MNVNAVLGLARAEIRAFRPYSSARMETSAVGVMLNANEMPWPNHGDTSDMNRYPEPQPSALRTRMARLYGVEPEQLLIGRGSDEAIDLLVRAFCRAGSEAILICPPTFGMYAVCAAVQGAKIVEVALDERFGLVPEQMLAACNTDVKLIFICSPNNPTGNCIPLLQIERLAAALLGRAVLVVDEAYIEFAAAPSAVSLIAKYPNVVVLRTLSKAWGLAGARIGALLAHAEIVALLRKIMPPYPVPTLSAAVALGALQDRKGMSRRIGRIRRERERLSAALIEITGVRRVLPSVANFVAVCFADAEAALKQLQAAGIAVRSLRHYPGLADALRITIGTPEQNTAVLAVLNTDDRQQRAMS